MDACLSPQEILTAPAAVTNPTLEVRWREGLSGLASLRTEWEALLESSGAAIFNGWEWQFSWAQRMGADRRLFALTARAPSGELVGLMPLKLERRSAFGRPLRRLGFLADAHVGSDYLEVLAAPAFEAAVAEAFCGALRREQAQWDVLDLLDLGAGSPMIAKLRQGFPGPDYVQQTFDRYICPYESLRPEPFEDFLKRTGRRDNYLRRRKWLERQPGYRIERTSDPAALTRPLGELFRLHHLRWAREGGSQGIESGRIEAFHRDACQLLAERGYIRLYTMWLGDQAVGSVYGILHRGTFYYYQSGFDPAWASKSVGLVLVGATFQDSLAEGRREYDFLRGTETYKSDWTTQRRTTVGLRIWPRGRVGGWLTPWESSGRVARNAVKAALPARAVQQIRALRRSWTLS